MQIDLTKLNNNVTTEITLNEELTFDKSYFEATDILALSEVKVMGSIIKNSEAEYVLNCEVNGNMQLEDSISLEVVEYPFSFEIEDEFVKTLENDENILDLGEVLWQNIMLEIPLKFTKVENFENFQGDGWKLISEEELKVNNNPFNDLKSMMGEE